MTTSIVRKVLTTLSRTDDDFVKAALAIPSKLEKLLADTDDPSFVESLLSEADGIEAYAKRIRADNSVLQAIGYGKLLVIAKLGGLLQAGKPGRGKKNPLPTRGIFASQTLADYRKVAKHDDALPDYRKDMQADPDAEITIAGFLRYADGIKHAFDKDERQKNREQVATEILAKDDDDYHVYHGDFREIGDQYVADESVDLIFTDPPYDAKSVPLYGDLAQFAQRKLRTGGSLMAYAGHYALDDVLSLMSPHLRLYWVCACYHTGNFARMPNHGIVVRWKPIVWYIKGPQRENIQTFVDDLVESEPAKDSHDWQQGVKEAAYYIEKLTPAHSLIVDPFAGSGTTLIAAKDLERSWIGFDIDENSVQIARSRIKTHT